jgi:hypothetical protein
LLKSNFSAPGRVRPARSLLQLDDLTNQHPEIMVKRPICGT